jgi:hypothetical protein
LDVAGDISNTHCSVVNKKCSEDMWNGRRQLRIIHNKQLRDFMMVKSRLHPAGPIKAGMQTAAYVQ